MPAILGLSASEADSYVSALRAPGVFTHRRATLMDLDLNPLRELADDEAILSGGVAINRRADVPVTAEAEFGGSLDLDLRHMVRLEFGVTVGESVLWAPLLTGWVVGCDDRGSSTGLRLHDKSAFGLRVDARGEAKRGEPVGRAIWRMHRSIGERHFAIPDALMDGGPKLAAPVQWGGGKPEKSVTRLSRRVAKKSGLQVFPDAWGRIVVRREPRQPALSLVEGAEGDVRLLSRLEFPADYTQTMNRVGGRAKRLSSWAEARGQFSPRNLERGGEPTRLTHRFTDDTADSQRELDRATEATLRRMGAVSSDVKVSCTPPVWLVAFDLIHAERRDGRSRNFALGEAGISLDGSATIGYVDNVWAPVKTRRRKR